MKIDNLRLRCASCSGDTLDVNADGRKFTDIVITDTDSEYLGVTLDMHDTQRLIDKLTKIVKESYIND